MGTETTRTVEENPSGWPEKDKASFAVGIFLLIGFGLATAQMFGYVHEEREQIWTRAMTIYSSVQTLAFAAASFIFGFKVQERRVQKAEENEKAALEHGAKGRALATAVKGASRRLKVGAALRPEDADGSEIDALDRLAGDLFPQA